MSVILFMYFRHKPKKLEGGRALQVVSTINTIDDNLVVYNNLFVCTFPTISGSYDLYIKVGGKATTKFTDKYAEGKPRINNVFNCIPPNIDKNNVYGYIEYFKFNNIDDDKTDVFNEFFNTLLATIDKCHNNFLQLEFQKTIFNYYNNINQDINGNILNSVVNTILEPEIRLGILFFLNNLSQQNQEIKTIYYAGGGNIKKGKLTPLDITILSYDVLKYAFKNDEEYIVLKDLSKDTAMSLLNILNFENIVNNLHDYCNQYSGIYSLHTLAIQCIMNNELYNNFDYDCTTREQFKEIVDKYFKKRNARLQ